MAASPSTADTRETLLQIATELVQHVGYNAFSYRDLAARAGITTASIHYHFPGKGDLGLALVVRQQTEAVAARAAIDAAARDDFHRLREFCAMFRSTLDAGQRLCLCGMLAAEQNSLPDALAAAVREYFLAHERWLAGVLRAGQRAGVFAVAPSAAVAARAFLAAIEGAMLVAKSFGDTGRFDAAIEWYLAALRA